LQDIGVDGRMSRIYIRGMGWEGMDWMHVAQDRYQWQALLNTVMNLQVP